MIRLPDLGDGALVLAAGQSISDRADQMLAITGEAFTSWTIAGRTPTLCDFDQRAFAMRLEGRMLRKESWQA